MNRFLLALIAIELVSDFSALYARAASDRTQPVVINDGTDGAFPYAGLLNVKGTLYGTTEGGGTDNNGTVFSFDPTTGVENVIYSFKKNPDGAYPRSSLISVTGTLYGTTQGGGSYGYGTVFKVDPKTGTESPIYSFRSGNDGDGPEGSLIDKKGTLYGTTSVGGTYGDGTVFSVDAATGAESVTHSFGSTSGDGITPFASLIDVRGMLYGTTENGGAGNYGTIFSLNPATGTENVLHSFFNNGSDGVNPVAGFINRDGELYSTTSSGGTYYQGVIFKFEIATRVETVLYSFAGGSDAAYPAASLVRIRDTLYGTTVDGGSYASGTIFSLKLADDAETVVHSFDQNGSDGNAPWAGLIEVNGMLYGTTAYGGTGTSCGSSYGCGTIFSVEPATGIEAVLYSFQ